MVLGGNGFWFAGPVPVCERAGREIVSANGFGLLVSREKERGENFWGEMVFVLDHP
jgi:hypothetical protein